MRGNGKLISAENDDGFLFNFINLNIYLVEFGVEFKKHLRHKNTILDLSILTCIFKFRLTGLKTDLGKFQLSLSCLCALSCHFAIWDMI